LSPFSATIVGDGDYSRIGRQCGRALKSRSVRGRGLVVSFVPYFEFKFKFIKQQPCCSEAVYSLCSSLLTY